MRCKNCGWPNKPNETVCVKCGSPLETETSVPNQDSRYEPSPGPVGQDRDGLKMTLMETDVFQSHEAPYASEPNGMASAVNEVTCPKCGYPLRADAVKCPNCNNKMVLRRGIGFSNSGTHTFTAHCQNCDKEVQFSDSELWKECLDIALNKEG